MTTENSGRLSLSDRRDKALALRGLLAELQQALVDYLRAKGLDYRAFANQFESGTHRSVITRLSSGSDAVTGGEGLKAVVTELEKGNTELRDRNLLPRIATAIEGLSDNERGLGVCGARSIRFCFSLLEYLGQMDKPPKPLTARQALAAAFGDDRETLSGILGSSIKIADLRKLDRDDALFLRVNGLLADHTKLKTEMAKFARAQKALLEEKGRKLAELAARLGPHEFGKQAELLDISPGTFTDARNGNAPLATVDSLIEKAEELLARRDRKDKPPRTTKADVTTSETGILLSEATPEQLLLALAGETGTDGIPRLTKASFQFLRAEMAQGAILEAEAVLQNTVALVNFLTRLKLPKVTKRELFDKLEPVMFELGLAMRAFASGNPGPLLELIEAERGLLKRTRQD